MEAVSMTRTITDLWNGNIAPCEHCGYRDQNIKELHALMERHEETLNKITTPQQQEVIAKYIDCFDEYLLRLTEHAFYEGFSLASKLWTEALLSDE